MLRPIVESGLLSDPQVRPSSSCLVETMHDVTTVGAAAGPDEAAGRARAEETPEPPPNGERNERRLIVCDTRYSISLEASTKYMSLSLSP